MFCLCSEININGIEFYSVNKVTVKRSVKTIADTAKIYLPVSSRLIQKGKHATNIETAKLFKIGDKVSIKLGYNGNLNTEFIGYVKQFNYKQPLEIECEDEFYNTRHKSINISGEMSLEELLNLCGLDVLYCEKLKLKNFVSDQKPVSWVLGKLKSKYGLDIFFTNEGKLIASKAFKTVDKTVKYRFRDNVISESELKFQKNTDHKILIKAVCFLSDGTKIEEKYGEEGGIVKNTYFYDVQDKDELQLLAEYEMQKYFSDSYKGRFKTFLFPFAQPCMNAELTDPLYFERDGNYFISSTDVSFSSSGARRTVEIGSQI
ncbi:MAG: hypothetical protein N4A49_06735 [Marinifilaceae bacterium]|jgi:hypothetical protein|nr:hypothetical protein [Marinifilaceae bacterium]